MSFTIRNKLMSVLFNNIVAYKVAFEFVDDNPDKLTVFMGALKQPLQEEDIEMKSRSAVDIASERWAAMYPVENE